MTDRDSLNWTRVALACTLFVAIGFCAALWNMSADFLACLQDNKLLRVQWPPIPIGPAKAENIPGRIAGPKPAPKQHEGVNLDQGEPKQSSDLEPSCGDHDCLTGKPYPIVQTLCADCEPIKGHLCVGGRDPNDGARVLAMRVRGEWLCYQVVPPDKDKETQ